VAQECKPSEGGQYAPWGCDTRKSTRKKSSATGEEVCIVALAQQLRHFHDAMRARSHVQERSALVQIMQEDAALLADLSIVLAGSEQHYRSLLTAWERAPTERHRYTVVLEAALTPLPRDGSVGTYSRGEPRCSCPFGYAPGVAHAEAPRGLCIPG
jgi:hypothetical protein